MMYIVGKFTFSSLKHKDVHIFCSLKKIQLIHLSKCNEACEMLKWKVFPDSHFKILTRKYTFPGKIFYLLFFVKKTKRTKRQLKKS